jgi:hypothetical protein
MSEAIALPVGLPPADGYWIHEDPAGISPAAARGLARAERRDWTRGPLEERAADFRGLLVYRSWIAAKILGSSGMNSERGALGMSPDYAIARENTSDSERARLVATLGKTGAILAAGAGATRSGWDAKTLHTQAGGDTAALPLVTIAVVTIIVAVAESAAVAYLAHEAKHVVDNWLARKAELAELAQSDAQVLRLLDHHVDRENEAGAVLPLDDAEKAALGMLEKRQVEAMKKLTGPTPVKDDGLPGWVFPASIAAAALTAFVLAKF